MSQASYVPDTVHLVGSIGLDGVEDVFSMVGPMLGRRLRRIPDGEPGPRRLWVSFQYPLLRSSPFLRPDPSGALRKTSGFPLLCLAEGVKAGEVEFGELGYAREARGSYLDFVAARERGDIAKGIRFQVCLPTPMSVNYAFCTARDVATIEPAYEKAMQKVEGNVTFHTARSTAFPQPAPGTAPSPGPMKVPDEKLRGMLGIASVNFKQNEQRLAIVDTPIQN